MTPPACPPAAGLRSCCRLSRGSRSAPAFACALGASILPEARGGGLARELLIGLRDAASAAGYEGVLAPVRPTAWTQMPHLTVAEYANVRLPDGRHFDPWVRTHEAVGGRIIGTCPDSAVFSGERADWERWTGTRLPENGRLIAPHTAGWLTITDDWGVLSEASLWLLHDLGGDDAASRDRSLSTPDRSRRVRAPGGVRRRAPTPGFARADAGTAPPRGRARQVSPDQRLSAARGASPWRPCTR